MKAIEQIDVRELLPQQGAFVMVDRLISNNDAETISTLLIRADNIFVTDGCFTEPGLLEHAAQTAAARNGYIDKYVRGGNIRLGFIGEIKKMKIEACPRVGEELTTSVRVVGEVLSTLLIRTETRVGDRLIASGEMKIAMTDIPSQV